MGKVTTDEQETAALSAQGSGAGRDAAGNGNGGGTSRRTELLEIAAETFAEKGVVATTTRDIARRADILSGSLYHHFKSKESMVDEIIQTYWDELFAVYDVVLTSDSDPISKLEELMRASLDLGICHRNEVLILHKDWHYLSAFLPYIEEHMERVEAAWVEVIEAGVRQGSLRADLNPFIVYRVMMGAINWVARWYNPDGELTLQDIADLKLDFYLRGMVAE